MTSLVWLRDDLRLADNPALRAAVDRGEPVVVLFVLDEESPGIRPLGGAARWWLHHSLQELGDRLADKGATLVLRRGAAGDVVPGAVADAGAESVFWNRRYGGPERAIDTQLKQQLRDDGREVESFAANLLFEPWTVRTGSGSPYSVFTPFWNTCLSLPAPRAPLAEPRTIDGAAAQDVKSDELAEWSLLPTRPDWAGGLREAWEPGELAARRRLRDFLDDDLGQYDRARDEPSAGATSLLSPRLRWGELSPHTVWHDTVAAAGSGAHAASAHRFLSELGWREFAWHTLFHFPDLATRNWRSAFDAFPWPRLTPSHLRAWQRGETGVPLVDAGMRELWTTGYMHNRVRMVTASYLVKNLAIDWRRGEEWFWDT
ncbi:MAG: deoxyribodipyrimidine photo-lyase, partial [Microbacterium sp.]